MSFTVKAMCQHGELFHRRKTAEAALKKAREMSRAGCYNVHIITPEGRDYHSSGFGDIPRTPVAERLFRKPTPARRLGQISVFRDRYGATSGIELVAVTQRPIEPLSRSADLPKLVDLRGQ